jgi:hypothetical protein
VHGGGGEPLIPRGQIIGGLEEVFSIVAAARHAGWGREVNKYISKWIIKMNTSRKVSNLRRWR